MLLSPCQHAHNNMLMFSRLIFIRVGQVLDCNRCTAGIILYNVWKIVHITYLPNFVEIHPVVFQIFHFDPHCVMTPVPVLFLFSIRPLSPAIFPSGPRSPRTFPPSCQLTARTHLHTCSHFYLYHSFELEHSFCHYIFFGFPALCSCYPCVLAFSSTWKPDFWWLKYLHCISLPFPASVVTHVGNAQGKIWGLPRTLWTMMSRYFSLNLSEGLTHIAIPRTMMLAKGSYF